MNKKMKLACMIGILLVGSAGGYYLYQQQHIKDVKSHMDIVFTNVKEIEYGRQDLDIRKTFVKAIKGAKLTHVSSLDTAEIGKKTLKFNLEKDGIKKTIKHVVKVIDTKAPIIDIESDQKEINIGESYDPTSNIKQVKDEVDGELAFHEKQKKQHYTIQGSIDTQIAKEYAFQVIAVDKHGLKTTKEFIVVVKEEAKPPVQSTNQPSNNGSSGSPSNGGNNGLSVTKGTKEAIVNTALAQISKTYQREASGPDAFDCSGLIYYAYRQNGWNIKRSVLSGATVIPFEERQPGDIIYLPQANHVVLYIGNDEFVEAENEQSGIHLGTILGLVSFQYEMIVYRHM